MSACPSVQVLLSTYNGTRYLGEFLESVRSQRGVSVEVFTRDDGSIDGSLGVLRRYAESGGVRVVDGKNLGPAKSFLWLLEHSSPDVDFISFADQDDVWLPDKLARATAALGAEQRASPAMYCSSLTLVDENLRPLGSWRGAPRGASFENALVQNIAPGCTIVINQAARELLVSRLPTSLTMHDWWIYQAVSATGTVIVDDQSRILYRKHAINTIGAPVSVSQRVVDSWRRFVARDFRLPSLSQLLELERCFGDLWSPRQRLLVARLREAHTSRRSRVAAAFDSGLVFQSTWHGIAYRILLLFGRFASSAA